MTLALCVVSFYALVVYTEYPAHSYDILLINVLMYLLGGHQLGHKEPVFASSRCKLD